MHYLLIPLCTIALIFQSVFQKQYGKKCGVGSITFSAMIALFACIFFAFVSIGKSYSLEILPHSLLFAASYSICTICSFLALKNGSLAITSLVLSYSLIIPTIYGLIFLKEPAGLFKYIGMALLVVSLYLVRQKRSDEDNQKTTPKWIIYLSIAFVSNGLCSVFQKRQQMTFDGKYDTSFMVIALLIGAAVMLLAALFLERKDIKTAIIKGAPWAFCSGMCNGIVNLLVMIIVSVVAASLFFPILSAGQIILTFVISALFFKEKFIPRQIIGMAFGIGALVFLNI